MGWFRLIFGLKLLLNFELILMAIFRYFAGKFKSNCRLEKCGQITEQQEIGMRLFGVQSAAEGRPISQQNQIVVALDQENRCDIVPISAV